MSPIAERIAEALATGAKDVATRSGVKGLTEEDVREGKTPEGIERIWLRRMMSRKTNKAIFEQEEQEAERQHEANPFPLLPYSQLVYNLEQEHPGVFSFTFAFSYDVEKIDTARLNEAIQTAVRNHPVFRGNEQYYCLEAIEAIPSIASIATIEPITPQGCLHIRLNRILGDGYSFGLLLEDICKVYQGIALEPDYYFRYLQQVENHKQSREYAEHEAELRARYGAVDGKRIPVRPTLDKEIETDDDWEAGEYVMMIDDRRCMVHDEGMTMNEKVCMATALAIMDYCGTDEAALTWAYLGRENELERHIFGSLHRDIPMRMHRGEDVKEEMQRGIRLSDYPWTLTDPQHEVWQYAVNVLQQPSLDDLNLHGLELLPAKLPLALSEAIWGTQSDRTPCGLRKGTAKPGERGFYSLLDIEIEENQLRFKYSATHYKRESIIRFAELIKKHCSLASDAIGQ